MFLCIIRRDWSRPLSRVQKTAAVVLVLSIGCLAFFVSRSSTLEEKQCGSHMEYNGEGVIKVPGKQPILPVRG